MQQSKEEFEIFQSLTKSKNLLAFSAGVDSSALFFMLIEQGVAFDIAIVDYNKRSSSKDEVIYAKELAEKYNKKIYIKSVKLEDSNFENKAREIRYSFFTEVIKENSYTTLLTAHHLGDKLEWFLMRLVRGSGTVELSGFSQKERYLDYEIVRPLIHYTKDELLEYLEKNSHKYFIDESNFDEKYERNYFRKNFSEPLLLKYKEGIKRSFIALESDKSALIDDKYKKVEELYIFERSSVELRKIVKILKLFGIVVSKPQRDEIASNDEVVISSKIAIGKNDKFVFICPYLSGVVMAKEAKELYRVNKIPKNIRGYLFKNSIEIDKIFNF